MKNLLFLIIIIFISCNGKDNLEKAGKITNETVLPLEVGKNIEFVYSDSAIIKAILKAPLMESYSQLEDPYIEMQEGLDVTFFGNNRQPSSFLTAKYGIQKTNQKIIEVRDSVVAINTQGDTLRSEELIWDEVKNKIFSDKQVTIKTTDETIIGQGFRSNPQFTEYEFFRIIGQFTIDNGEE